MELLPLARINYILPHIIHKYNIIILRRAQDDVITSTLSVIHHGQ